MDNCATDSVTTQPYCLSRMYSRPMRERVGLHCKSVKDATPDWSMRPKFRPRCIRAIALWDPWRSRGPSVFGARSPPTVQPWLRLCLPLGRRLDLETKARIGSDRSVGSDRIGSKIGSVSMPALYVILNSICMPRFRRRSVEGRNIGPGLGLGLDSSVPVSISVPEKCLDSGYLVLALNIIGTLSVSNRQSCIE